MKLNKSETSMDYTIFLRALCVKALTEEGDANGSGSLDFTEFRKLLSDSFSPSSKCKFPFTNHLITFNLFQCAVYLADLKSCTMEQRQLKAAMHGTYLKKNIK